jgi:hypothetical protein
LPTRTGGSTSASHEGKPAGAADPRQLGRSAGVTRT